MPLSSCLDSTSTVTGRPTAAAIRLIDAKQQWLRLLLEPRGTTDERQPRGLARRHRHRGEDTLYVLQLGADGLDPQLVGIDDFEQGLARIHHLAQMHIGGGDDA